MARETKNNRYTEAVGRRKTAIARVRITPDTKTTYTVNDIDFATYFPIRELTETVESALTAAAQDQAFSVTARIVGGGQVAQAQALRHGIARALVKYDAELRKSLKTPGFLKRDARTKERKKFGLRKARRAPQWSKR